MSLTSLRDHAVAFLVREGKTSFGKAVEHAVVAGVAVGISLLAKDFATGSLSLSDVQAAAVAVASAVLAGLRAAVKHQVAQVSAEAEDASRSA